MALEGWLLLRILKLYRFPIQPGSTIDDDDVVPDRNVPAGHELSRSTLPWRAPPACTCASCPCPCRRAAWGPSRCAWRSDSPWPCRTGITFAPPGTPLTMDWPVILVNVAVVGREVPLHRRVDALEGQLDRRRGRLRRPAGVRRVVDEPVSALRADVRGVRDLAVGLVDLAELAVAGLAHDPVAERVPLRARALERDRHLGRARLALGRDVGARRDGQERHVDDRGGDVRDAPLIADPVVERVLAGEEGRSRCT